MREIKQTWPLSFVLWAMLAIVLHACTTANPLAQAQTIEQRAFAAYGMFVILQERAVVLTSPGSALPRETQLRIIDVSQRAQVATDDLLLAYLEYENVRAQFAASDDRVQFALSNLRRWTEQAEGHVQNLRSTLR